MCHKFTFYSLTYLQTGWKGFYTTLYWPVLCAADSTKCDDSDKHTQNQSKTKRHDYPCNNVHTQYRGI